MTTRKYKIKPGQQWQQLPDAVISLTNTSSSGTQVAVTVQGQSKTLPPNGCVKLTGPQVAHVMAQNGHGEVTCELPD